MNARIPRERRYGREEAFSTIGPLGEENSMALRSPLLIIADLWDYVFVAIRFVSFHVINRADVTPRA